MLSCWQSLAHHIEYMRCDVFVWVFASEMSKKWWISIDCQHFQFGFQIQIDRLIGGDLTNRAFSTHWINWSVLCFACKVPVLCFACNESAVQPKGGSKLKTSILSRCSSSIRRLFDDNVDDLVKIFIDTTRPLLSVKLQQHTTKPWVTLYRE